MKSQGLMLEIRKEVENNKKVFDSENDNQWKAAAFQDFNKNREKKLVQVASRKSLQPNNRLDELTKAFDESQENLAKISGQLSYYKSKTFQLLQKVEMYEKIYVQIAETLSIMSSKLRIETPRWINQISYDRSILEGEQFSNNLLSALGEVDNRMTIILKQVHENENQGSQSVKKLRFEHEELIRQNAELLAFIDKRKQYSECLKTKIQKMKSIIENQKIDLNNYRQAQKNTLSIINDLDLKTKNRSELTLMLKGVLKKHLLHETKCPHFQLNPRLTPADIQEHAQKKKKQFENNKIKLEKILDFE